MSSPNHNLHSELLSSLTAAEASLENSRLVIMNTMADAIIEQNNVTADIEEFALAIHGIRFWTRGHTRGHNDPATYAPEANVYTEIEEAGYAGDTIMMHAYSKKHFAMAPHTLTYQRSPYNQPLRFTMHMKYRDTYTGSVLLPVIEDKGYGGKIEPSVLEIARFEREQDSLKVEYHPGTFSNDWHIGKSAVVSAAIVDYGSTREQDKAFLDRLDEATANIDKLAANAKESDWNDVFRNWQSPTYGAD